MKNGEIVVILAKLDQRVRTKKIDKDGFLKGTIDQTLQNDMFSVLLEDGDILICNKRELALAKEQE